MRLTGHVWFPALDYETMVTWILQKPDWVVVVGLLSSGNDCWRVSTKVN
jgi:hypothetical protein